MDSYILCGGKSIHNAIYLKDARKGIRETIKPILIMLSSLNGGHSLGDVFWALLPSIVVGTTCITSTKICAMMHFINQHIILKTDV